MSEQWYCPNCGPVTITKERCFETDTTYIGCKLCNSLEVSQSIPPFVIAYQERIALLEKVAIHAQFYLEDLMDADGYELDEALRAAGYLGEGNE